MHKTEEEISYHIHEDGTVHTHSHNHEHTKAVINRLSKAIGHLEAVKRMVEDGRDCTEREESTASGRFWQCCLPVCACLYACSDIIWAQYM